MLRNYVSEANAPMMDAAIETMRGLGATVVDDLVVPAEALALRAQYYPIISETEFKTLLGEYLATYRPGATVSSHQDVYEASIAEGFGMAPEVVTRLEGETKRGTMSDPDYLAAVAEGPAAMRAAIDKLLADNDLDALVRPTASGSDLAALSGYPDMLVPGGLSTDGTSSGLAFLSTAFTEPQLLGYAYSYEQATHARVTPALTPPIPASWWR